MVSTRANWSALLCGLCAVCGEPFLCGLSVLAPLREIVHFFTVDGLDWAGTPLWSSTARPESGQGATGSPIRQPPLPRARESAIDQYPFLPVGNPKEKSDISFPLQANSPLSPTALVVNVLGYKLESGVGGKSRSQKRCQVLGVGRQAVVRRQKVDACYLTSSSRPHCSDGWTRFRPGMKRQERRIVPSAKPRLSKMYQKQKGLAFRAKMSKHLSYSNTKS